MTETDNLISQSHQTRVKICGLTNLEDAHYAAKAGAEYLGFVFYPKSKRFVSVDVVCQISAEIQSSGEAPLLVGVFVDESIERMSEILDSCSLDLAQMNGDEPPSFICDTASPLYGRSYKALKPISLSAARLEAEGFIPPVRKRHFPSLLIDAYHPTLPGGTGEVADWFIAGKLAANIPGLMLAGGLNPANVSTAIEKVQPFVVDVASGVESEPGKKDPTLVRAFISAAKKL